LTLVAALPRLGHPVVIGDLLVSSPRRATNIPKLNVPAVPNVNARLASTSSYVVSAVARKLAILGGRLAIGCAGSAIAAKAVVSDLKTVVERGGFQKSDLDALLASLGPDYLGKQEVSLCGALAEGNRMTLFGWNAEQFTTPAGETVFASGTGADELKHMLGALSYRDEREQREKNPVAASLLSIMGATGVLLGEQIRIGKNIDAFFGGGFEVVTPSDGAMQAMPITYLFLEATITLTKEMTITFHRLLTFDYLGDILLVYVLDPLIEDAKKEIYVLSPLYRRVTEPELVEFRNSRQAWPRTKLTCVYVYLPQAVESHRISVQAHFAGLSDPAITVVEASEMIELGLSEALRVRILQHAAEVCGIW
jgi:hypothetical protein